MTKDAVNFRALYKECSIPSPCWMTHREDLKMVGGFDSDRYPEDYDLAFRFAKAKLKLALQASPRKNHRYKPHV